MSTLGRGGREGKKEKKVVDFVKTKRMKKRIIQEQRMDEGSDCRGKCI